VAQSPAREPEKKRCSSREREPTTVLQIEP
jgi:hypothetical protein